MTYGTYHDALVDSAINALDRVADDATSREQRRESILALMHHTSVLLASVVNEEEVVIFAALDAVVTHDEVVLAREPKPGDCCGGSCGQTNGKFPG